MILRVRRKILEITTFPNIILIVAQKNYVLDAPLGDRPIAGADADVMNVWLAQYDDYLIV